MYESVISWVSVEICSSVRLARSGGRSARGVCEVEAPGTGWDDEEGGSTSVLSDMVVSTKVGHETGAGGRSSNLRDGERVRVTSDDVVTDAGLLHFFLHFF